LRESVRNWDNENPPFSKGERAWEGLTGRLLRRGAPRNDRKKQGNKVGNENGLSLSPAGSQRGTKIPFNPPLKKGERTWEGLTGRLLRPPACAGVPRNDRKL
jgi:hypothetical protein